MRTTAIDREKWKRPVKAEGLTVCATRHEVAHKERRVETNYTKAMYNVQNTWKLVIHTFITSCLFTSVSSGISRVGYKVSC